MDVIVSARHRTVPEALRRTAEEKIQRLARFVDGMERAEVHFSEERNPRIVEREVCEVTMEGHGHHVRCKVRAADTGAAVDQAVAKLEQQLQKLKTKLHRRHQGPPVRSARSLEPAASTGDDTVTGAAAGERLAPASGPEPQADGSAAPRAPRAPRIVKSKQFASMPMTAEDAVTRMDLLGHGFFFFTNLDTGRAAVVYQRDDGDVGLIDETP
ncbi:MAG: ribosome-associated translation inhibitor RaiA [Actinobacteria bacterium]|nr:ribosome-associated translation inhibitor RaiA [Actinomycetota bacterium]